MDLEQAVQTITEGIGLPSDFLIGLPKERDWSFVIITHAFMEALLTHAIADALCRPELSDVLSRIEMSRPQVGKVVIAKALNLIADDGERFLTKLSRLRNRLVHDVKRIDFEFSSYLNGLDNNQTREFIRAFSYFASEDDISQHGDIVNSLVREDPKYAVWLSAMHFTGVIFWKRDVQRLETLNQAMKADLDRKIAEANNQACDNRSEPTS